MHLRHCGRCPHASTTTSSKMYLDLNRRPLRYERPNAQPKRHSSAPPTKSEQRRNCSTCLVKTWAYTLPDRGALPSASGKFCSAPIGAPPKKVPPGWRRRVSAQTYVFNPINRSISSSAARHPSRPQSQNFEQSISRHQGQPRNGTS